MSCRNTLYKSEANVNRYLENELKTDREFSGDELNLLNEYQSIKSEPDYIFLLVCAKEAEMELKKEYPDSMLTEYGVVVRSFLQSEYYSGEGERAVAQKKYVDMLVDSNKRFLRLWEEIKKRKDKQRQKINKLTGETRDLIDNSTGLLYSLELVAEEMMRDEFALIDPGVLKTPPSVALTQGVHVVAENKEGVQREVWLYLAGGKVKTEVHVPSSHQGPSCFDLAGDFARNISKVLEKASESCGAPVIFDLGNTEPSSSGKNPEPVFDFQHTVNGDPDLNRT